MGAASIIVNTIVYIFVYIVVYNVIYSFKYYKMLVLGPDIYDDILPGRFAEPIIIPIEILASVIYKVVTNFVHYPIALVLILWVIRCILLLIPIIGIILLQIPPFPDFEDSGLFRLIDRILGTFGQNAERLLVACGISIELILVFTKDSLKKILQALFPNFDTSSVDNKFDDADKHSSENAGPPVVTVEDQESVKEEKKRESTDDYYANTKKAIEIETANCINANTIPITPDLNFKDRMMVTIQNNTSSVKCNADSVDSYIKANLQYLMI